MEYGEIIGALQHVASCACSLRLVNCVGADRAQSFERQVRETLDLLGGTDAVTVPQAIALVCQLALDCIGLTNAVDLELASHMTECFDQSLVVWGFSVELARAIAMSLAAVAGLLSLGSHDMSIPSHRYAKRAQIAPYLEPVAADFDMISMQVYGALCRFEAEASSGEEERQLQSSFQLICVWILTILSRFEGGRLEPASLWEWANGDPQWALVLSKGLLSSSSDDSSGFEALLPCELPELKNAVLLALCGLPSPDIAFGGELEADVIADDLGVIGCFSMQERLVGLDLHRSRLALAACDSSLLKPLLDHAEASSRKAECVKALVPFVAALAKPVQSQAGAWADVIAEANADTGISNHADAAGVIDAFLAEAAGYGRSLWGLVFGLAPEDLELRWVSELALLAQLLPPPPPASEASEALRAWLCTPSASPSASWMAHWVVFAAGAGLEPEEDGAQELRSALSRLTDKEQAQVTQHLARSRAPVRRPETWERWYSCVSASTGAAASDTPAPPPPPPPPPSAKPTEPTEPTEPEPEAPTPPAGKAPIARPSGNSSLRERLRDAPAELCCRLDGKLLVDPVRSPAGHVFERTNLAKALQSNGGLCPLTSEPLSLAECPRAAELRLQATQWVRSAGRGQR